MSGGGYLGSASHRGTHSIYEPELKRTGAPSPGKEAFFYDSFDIHGKHVQLPVPADLVARLKQSVPDYRDPTALQKFSRDLKARFGAEQVGRIYFKEDFNPHSKHATLPEAKPLGEAGKHISIKEEKPTATQERAREKAEGGRMAHADDYEQYGQHAHKPEAKGRSTGEMSKRAIAGIGRHAPSMSGAPFKHGGIVKGKKGHAVPIVAHAGELVVPTNVVPKVLKSSAWIDHVKSVQKAQGVSYKEAMKLAKGTYKK